MGPVSGLFLGLDWILGVEGMHLFVRSSLELVGCMSMLRSSICLVKRALILVADAMLLAQGYILLVTSIILLFVGMGRAGGKLLVVRVLELRSVVGLLRSLAPMKGAKLLGRGDRMLSSGAMLVRGSRRRDAVLLVGRGPILCVPSESGLRVGVGSRPGFGRLRFVIKLVISASMLVHGGVPKWRSRPVKLGEVPRRRQGGDYGSRVVFGLRDGSLWFGDGGGG